VIFFLCGFFLLKDHFKSLSDIKSSILGLSSIFYVPLVELPLSIRGELGTILGTIMDLQQKYTQILQDKAAQIEQEENQLNEVISDNEGGGTPSSDQVPKIGDEDIDFDVLGGPMTAPVLAKLQEMYQYQLSEEDDDEEIDYATYLANIDELNFFVEALKLFSGRDSAAYQQLINTFSPQQKLKLEECVNNAQERKLQ